MQTSLTNYMNKKIVYGLIAVAVIVVGLYVVNMRITEVTPQNTEAKTVNFGAVLALTGFAVNEGTQLQNGIELAKTDLAKEGITMNVEYYDDATDPKKSIAGVELMNSKGIKTIFGPTWSYMISAALPTLSKYGMTAFIGDTSSDVVEGDATQKSRLVHGISPIYQIEQPSVAWMKEHNVKKLAILTVDGTWGVVHTAAWKKSALSAGAETTMVEMFTYTSEPTVLETLIVKAKSQGVDGIVWTGTEAGAISIINKMKEIGYDVPVLGTVYLKLAVTTGKVMSGNLDLFEIEKISSQAFRDKYKAVYGVEPGAVAEPAYDLAVIAARTELEKGAMTTQEYLLSKSHKGFANNYTFDANGDVINHGWVVTII
jgi:ABC-type branched-subunit amino acid transport system substrate-binding protein